MHSIILAGILEQLKKAPLTVFHGDQPQALLDIKKQAEKIFEDQSLKITEISQDEVAALNFPDFRRLLSNARHEAIEKKIPHFIFTTVSSPVIANEVDQLVKVSYFDDRFLSQGPRLIELSIDKARGYKTASGESIVVNPYDE